MEPDGPTPAARIATAADLDAIVRTLTSAFFDDPVWGPSFPDVARRASQMSAFWRLLCASALRFPQTFVTAGVESVAVWLPPGADELTEDESSGLESFVADLVGDAPSRQIMAVMAQFEHARPIEPHYYLSLLGTHADHRGRGLGMSLLRENLARIDALGIAAYLESTNPANDVRYRRVGFEPNGGFTTATGQVVTTMWRSGR